jgi:hypothetical protein
MSETLDLDAIEASTNEHNWREAVASLAAEVRRLDAAIAHIAAVYEPSSHDALNDATMVRFKSMPDHEAARRAAAWMLGCAARLLRAEVEHAPPELRNRMTVCMSWDDERWNLTLARGDYEHAMEAQRDAARAERDAVVKALNDSEVRLHALRTATRGEP